MDMKSAAHQILSVKHYCWIVQHCAVQNSVIMCFALMWLGSGDVCTVYCFIAHYWLHFIWMHKNVAVHCTSWVSSLGPVTGDRWNEWPYAAALSPNQQLRVTLSLSSQSSSSYSLSPYAAKLSIPINNSLCSFISPLPSTMSSTLLSQ